MDKFSFRCLSSSSALLTVGFVIQFQKPVIIGVRAGIDVNIFRSILRNEYSRTRGTSNRIRRGSMRMQLAVSHPNLLNRNSVMTENARMTF